MSQESLSFQLDGKNIKLPIVVGTENEKALDITQLRSDSGYITLDSGYKNTGATSSAITFLNGEQGILHYRGYDIADLANNATFTEVSYLIIHGELPSAEQLKAYEANLLQYTQLPAGFENVQKAIQPSTHPMAQLASALCALSGYYDGDLAAVTDDNIAKVIGSLQVLVANIQRHINHQEFLPSTGKGFVKDFLTRAFGEEPNDIIVDALDKLLILHVDHEQNCSTSTVRIVGSSKANIFASVTGGIVALWGPLHGGANQQVLEMLEAIKADGGNTDKFIEKAKDKDDPFRLMGFGHRVYKNFDPRAKIIKRASDNVLNHLGINDKTLEIAKRLEEVALTDEYFISRNLYPNVDFYSGIIYKALGFPSSMFTTLFALGRVSGWLANWKEMRDRKEPIGRPRQVYTGEKLRKYVPINER
ncbi:MAG: citrate synthase [Chitinophagales bacterium]|nr:citrate synthase [Chitinophagales bacterium]